MGVPSFNEKECDFMNLEELIEYCKTNEVFAEKMRKAINVDAAFAIATMDTRIKEAKEDFVEAMRSWDPTLPWL